MQPIFPFVVGCPRSGTTLLRAMLDSHPDLAVPHETYFVGSTLRSAARRGSDGFDRQQLLDEIVATKSFQLWELPDRYLSELRADDEIRDVGTLLLRLYSAYAESRGKHRYADKTPRNIFVIDAIAAALPSARFVHLIRDGRNVVPSVMAMPTGPTDFYATVRYWQHRVSAGRRAGERLGPLRYRELRYEDLVDDPEAALRDICDFIDLPYDPEMLDYPERSNEILAGLRYQDLHNQVTQPPTRNVRDWRTSMPRRDVEALEGLAGRLLQDLGYDLSGFEPSPRLRAELLARRIAWSADSLFHTVRKRVAPRADG